MTQQVFDREDFTNEGDDVKRDAFQSVMLLYKTKLTEENFYNIVSEAFTLYGFVLRAQILEGVSKALEDGNLTEDIIDKTIRYLARRVDSCAATLGDMVILVNETKTPGSRH